MLSLLPNKVQFLHLIMRLDSKKTKVSLVTLSNMQSTYLNLFYQIREKDYSLPCTRLHVPINVFLIILNSSYEIIPKFI